jgi:hypothetical protein
VASPAPVVPTTSDSKTAEYNSRSAQPGTAA